MIYVDLPNPPDRVVHSASISANVEDTLRTVTSVVQPAEVRYKFKQRFFSPDQGQTTIRLYDYPALVLDLTDYSFELEGWDIRMPCAAINELPRQICRKFMTLWGKSTRRSLTPVESEIWLKIIDQVDYTQFAVERAEPRTLEGLLLRKQPFYYVEWSDGDRVQLDRDVAGALELVDPGELFTARVKLGLNDRIIELSSVVPLGPEDAVMAEAFAGWPTPR